jgi:hypothetical protein
MLDYRFTCDAAPVQAEGTLDGHPFYTERQAPSQPATWRWRKLEI